MKIKVEIEYVQYTGDNETEVESFVGEKFSEGYYIDGWEGDAVTFLREIKTKEQYLLFAEGDYLLRGKNKKFLVVPEECFEDIFMEEQ